jgi:hypothetical protein
MCECERGKRERKRGWIDREFLSVRERERKTKGGEIEGRGRCMRERERRDRERREDGLERE